MNKKIISVMFVLILYLSQIAFANNELTWSDFDSMTDKALLLTKQGKYAEAKQTLTNFSEQFVKHFPKDDNISMNDLRVITISADEAIRAVTAVSLSDSERIRKVTQLRLALDALHSEHQPMWRAMEETVLQSFANLKEFALSGDTEKFKLQYNQFSVAIDTIYPSLVLDLDPEVISRLDSHLRFLETYDRITEQNKKEHMTLMEEDMYNLFGKTRGDQADPSLVWVMVTTGSVILVTLVYVAWRKYKGERISKMKDQGRP
ncbi:sporulation protein YpjB [Calidifontibacillus oryziterrae]|uniref:sporulation protein YpjB n=1 Tax=Calidifontibacillus oryziterrae TaxID=1191699 RepID=UPI000313244F|nr:sporulation protein YpjB [Calidifontibacillus oryziterrae]